MKRKFTKLMFLMSGLLVLPLLSGCGGNSKWELSGDLVYLKGSIDKPLQNGYLEYTINDSFPYFTDNKSLDDLLCFNCSTIEKDTSKKEDYIFDIEYLKKHKANIRDVSVSKDHNSLSFTFEGNDEDVYGVVLSKNYSSQNKVIYSNADCSYSDLQKRGDQTAFEQKFLANIGPTWNIDSSKLDFYGYYDDVISENSLITRSVTPSNLAGATNFGVVPVTAIITGIKITYKIISTIYGAYKDSRTPTMNDLYNKLVEIDNHLTTISKQINDNHQKALELYSEEMFAVDRNAILTLDNKFYAFNQQYNVGLDNTASLLGLKISDSFKEYVKSGKTITVYYDTKNDAYAPYATKEDPSYVEYSVNVEDFKAAKEFLAAHNDTPDVGFTEAIKSDITNYVVKGAYPTAITMDTLVNDLYSIIEASFLTDYYSGAEGNQRAKELVILVGNYASTIASEIASNYLQRMELIYNFSKEGLDSIRQIYSSLLYRLDKFTALATLAADVAKVAYPRALHDQYVAARKAIVDNYNSVKLLPNNFCYINQARITGKVLTITAKASASGFGKNTFKGEFEVRNKYKNKSGEEIDDKLDITTFANDMIPSEVIHRMSKRWQALRDTGNCDDLNFLTYLVHMGAFPIDQADEIAIAQNRELISANFQRYDLDASEDSNLVVKITERHSGGGPETFPDSDKPYKYAYKNPEQWNGIKLVTQKFNATTGQALRNGFIAAYAEYYTAPFIGIGGRHMAFVDDVANHTYYALYSMHA